MAGFVPLSEFDFSVRLSTSVMTVKAGQSISVPVMLGTHRGKPRPVTLATSDWKSAGLGAEIVPSTVLSTGGAALNVTVPAGTPPGSYLFTVRGAAEGTFKTSNAALTVVVEPENAEGDGQEPSQEQGGPDMVPESASAAAVARAKRGVLARSVKTAAPRRPASPGQRAALVVIMVVMACVLVYYFWTTLQHGSIGSAGSAGGMSGTYAGTSTFCIASVLGSAPECGTSATPDIQIDSAGDVLGPVLFGKITDGSFDGEARAGDGTTFPMSGTFSNGTLSVEYRSSSVTWTITLHKQ